MHWLQKAMLKSSFLLIVLYLICTINFLQHNLVGLEACLPQASLVAALICKIVIMRKHIIELI